MVKIGEDHRVQLQRILEAPVHWLLYRLYTHSVIARHLVELKWQDSPILYWNEWLHLLDSAICVFHKPSHTACELGCHICNFDEDWPILGMIRRKLQYRELLVLLLLVYNNHAPYTVTRLHLFVLYV